MVASLHVTSFYGRICDDVDKHDPDTIDAICQNIDGLQKISGERIFTELKKTIQGKFGIDLFTKLIECGAARYIGWLFDAIAILSFFLLE